MPPEPDFGAVASSSGGEFVILWAARVAILLYVVAVACRLTGRWRPARAAWTGGCVALLVHLASALHFVHHWDLDAAYAEIARQTDATYGVDWGGGLYINFLFAAVWLADAAWWWVSPASYMNRPRALELVVHGFMAFIVFNAVVVFPKSIIRWLGLGACVVLGAMVVVTKRTATTPS